MTLSKPKARLQRLFDGLSAPYSRFVSSRLSRETRKDVAWIRPSPGDRVLDLACGPGTLAVEMACYGCRVVGLDLAEQMIMQARRAAREHRRALVHLVLADAEQLPIPDKMFDLATCGFSFAVFPAPLRTVAEIRRVTRPGGRVAILEVVAPENPAQSSELHRLEKLRSGGVPVHLVTLPELLGLFNGAGFDLLDACVSERRRHVDDWLDGAAVCAGAAGRRRLRRRLLETARDDSAGLHLERHGGKWFYRARVARLLWQRK
ncbi:MAG TPA: methyltransferase domain-containing protein [Candidatus Acidoferrales bacterium]|jgi:ubiquinone/menaquinone biosynthesis C-methylase UbiE|nr:methyltransferase domain-containing protein [Candidatus Acidoferrales bacterium]